MQELKEGQSKRSSRVRRRPKKRILAEGLKGEPPQETSNARNGVLRAVVHIHGDHEHDNICNNETRNQPGNPFPEMLDIPVVNRSPGGDGRRFRIHRVDSVAAPPRVFSGHLHNSGAKVGKSGRFGERDKVNNEAV